MNVYHLRCIATDYPQLVEIGVLLGVIQQADDVICTVDPADYWDFIGPVPKPTGALNDEGDPISAPAADENGNVYIHVNLMTKTNLKEAATAIAVAHPEVAEGLVNLGKYFLLDAEGNARAPALPYRKFAGQ